MNHSPLKADLEGAARIHPHPPGRLRKASPSTCTPCYARSMGGRSAAPIAVLALFVLATCSCGGGALKVAANRFTWGPQDASQGAPWIVYTIYHGGRIYVLYAYVVPATAAALTAALESFRLAP